MVWLNEANWQRSVERNSESAFFSANSFSNFQQNIMVAGEQHM
jgi:hypothetical protein